MAQHAWQSEDLYFKMHGLTAQAPEALNETLRRAIESMHRTLYAPSRYELTPSELVLLDRTGVDVEEHPDREDPMTEYATEFGVFQKTRVMNRRHGEPWLVGFETDKPMRLLDLTGSFPTRAGASMGLMTGSRSVSRAWARAFHDSWPEIDGLYYHSSTHANRPAMVLNERALEAGVIPDQTSFHRSLGDPVIFSILRNAAHALGYALL